MDIRQLPGYIPPSKTSAAKTGNLAAVPASLTKVDAPNPEPAEVFSPTAPAAKQELLASTTATSTQSEVSPAISSQQTWQIGDLTPTATGNGPLVTFDQPPSEKTSSGSLDRALSFGEILMGISAEAQPSAAKAMKERENGYLEKFPYKNDEAALKTRNGLTERYNDPTTSAQSMTSTITQHAQQRGIEIDRVPQNLTGPLSKESLGDVKQATQGLVDKLFLSKDASFNPEKHATVSKETERFLELAMQVAPKNFTAADAYKLVAGNLALISYQDKAAAENLLGDHGVRHLLGHNITACEALADGLERRGVNVSPMDRLVMHQAMIVHDLGYAMDSVRNPINSEGLKGQDAGHNVLAARYLRERSQNPDDPVAKLFGQGDLERMHRCVLFHDKDENGGPGVHFKMKPFPSEEERAVNLETMTRVADNSHAFEDKLPELLYRKPQSLKAMRMMKTAGELGDQGLVNTIKGELAEMIKADSDLAKDDKEALLQSVSSVHTKSYQFSVGRISGSKPTFDVSETGKVQLSVSESDTHQQTSALFGMDSYKQMEKFVKDCAGQKVSLKGNDEIIDGDDVCVIVRGPGVPQNDEFNTELHKGLLSDRAFVKFALLDSQLSHHQSILESRKALGSTDLEFSIQEAKDQRRAALDAYRNGSSLA